MDNTHEKLLTLTVEADRRHKKLLMRLKTAEHSNARLHKSYNEIRLENMGLKERLGQEIDRNSEITSGVLYSSSHSMHDAIMEASKMERLPEALARVCVWENDRILRGQKIRISPYDSCFRYMIEKTMEAWKIKNKVQS